MPDNSHNRSVSAHTSVLGPSGRPADTEGQWKAPGSSTFFGWMDSRGGFCTVRMEDVTALIAHDNGKFACVLRNGQQAVMDASDGFRMMRKMGWTQEQ